MNRICVLNSSKKVHLSTRNGFIELCRFIFATSLFLGRFSIAIFLSQSMTYMYGILQYPDDWRLRYITHIGYVLVASVIVYFSVEMLKHFSIGQKIRHLMFKK